MTAKQLFSKTMPFVWAKLLLGGATVLVCVILLAIFMGLGWLFGDTAIAIMFILWLGSIGAVRYFIMRAMGYLVKAGHIAVIAEACFTGQVPANQVAYGKEMVTKRFATSAIYFAVDQLISGAVKQIQDKIAKLGNKLDFIPGMGAVTGLAQFFVSISLGYIDECCLGWTFYNKDQGAFKSAADGVVIYAQNWKVLLKDAAKTMLKVILLTVLVALLIFVPIGLLFKLFKWSGFVAFVLALLIAWVVKFAFMDSYIMIQMMASYMSVAPNTVITFDLYSTLCTWSKKFKELFTKGQEEAPQAAYAGVATAGGQAYAGASGQTFAGNAGTVNPAQQAYTAPTAAASNTAAPAAGAKFCGQCGFKNEAGTKFCGSCGAKL